MVPEAVILKSPVKEVPSTSMVAALIALIVNVAAVVISMSVAYAATILETLTYLHQPKLHLLGLNVLYLHQQMKEMQQLQNPF